MKKIISRLGLIILAAGALGLLAFGPRPASNAPSDRVRIAYWEKWTGLEADQMKIVVDDFNNTVGKEKGIWVDYVSMSQIDRKMIISTAAGAPPDVVGLWDRQVSQFATLGALMPLDKIASDYGLTRDKYIPAFWDGCVTNGQLYAMPSTVFSVAMMYNKQLFEEKADALRAKGLDPTRPPQTMEELENYSKVIDTWADPDHKHLSIAGFVPTEPGSFTNLYWMWFGGKLADETNRKLLLTSPPLIATYDWIAGYSKRIGRDQIAEFRSGFNSGATSMYDTPQNPFLAGQIAMETQGPWATAFIEKLRPEANRWRVPADQLQREKDFENVKIGMTLNEIEKILGSARSGAPADSGKSVLHWAGGIKDLSVTVEGGKVVEKKDKLLPSKERQQYCQFGAAAFPSAVPGMKDVTAAGMDVWAIPSTAKHKKEAFEFIAFASRQKNIELVSMLHCNLSPLKEKSREYLEEHPNAYVDVFEALAASPNAVPVPKVVNWPLVFDQLTQVAERAYLLQGEPKDILREIETRTQKELDKEPIFKPKDAATAGVPIQ